MTWREVCAFLTALGIPVSRSPPTLLHALREGHVYQELIHRISPAYYVRHRVGHVHEQSRNYVFKTVQRFFETDLVIGVVGCQKVDIADLVGGRARVHLELLETFKTLIEARREHDEHRRDALALRTAEGY